MTVDFRVGDPVETLRDVDGLPAGTQAKVASLSRVASDVVRIKVGSEPDPFGDESIVVNVKNLRRIPDDG